MDYGAIIQVIFGVVGELLATGQRQEAENLLNRMRQEFQGIPLPDLKEIEAEQLGPSALESIRTDPTVEGAQYETLGQLGELASTGAGAQDKAALIAMANMTARRNRATQAGIETDMAARGLQGSGLEYGLRQAAGQDANQRVSEAGTQIAGDAAQRRMNAILARGDFSGRMRGQQYDEKSRAAAARDAIMKANAGMRMSAKQYNAQLPQQRFANSMQKTGAMANPTYALAANYNNNATDTRNAMTGYGAAAGKWFNSLDDEDEDKDKDNNWD